MESTSTTFQLIPETYSVQLGKGTVKNCFASGVLFHASVKTDTGVPEHLVVTAGADSASADINIRSGEIRSIEILDTNGNKITGDIILSRNDVYEFDAVGYDEFGNTVEIFPSWTVNSYLGTLDTVNPGNAGILNESGTGTGKIRIQLGNFSDDQQVMVRPKLLLTDPVDGAINILLDARTLYIYK